MASDAAASEARPEAASDAPTAGWDAPGEAEAAPDASGGARPSIAFEDVTLRAGLELWRSPADGDRSMAARIGGGVCLLQVDGEGPLDILFAWQRDAEGRGSGVRLLVASEPWRYRDETEERGLSETGAVLGCLAFDADGDGDQDLLLTGEGLVELWEQRDGRFVRRPELLQADLDPEGLYTSAAAADLDGDGDLDLAVGGFTKRRPSPPPGARCYTEECFFEVLYFEPIASVALRHLDGGVFQQDTMALAPELGLPEPTLALVASDLNEDGWPDLYVGNDLQYDYTDRALLGPPPLLDDGLALGIVLDDVRTGSCTMGLARGDIDGNGLLDLARTSFEADPSDVFLCFETPGVQCAEWGYRLGVDDGMEWFRWANAIVDLDNDGWPELVEVGGNLLRWEERSLIPEAQHPGPQPVLVFHNEAGERLRLLSPDPGDGLNVPVEGRGLAVGDLDDDGRLDLVVSPSRGRPLLLRNVSRPGGRWMRVSLRSPAPNPFAVGARVWLQLASGRRLVREVRAGEGYLGSFGPRLHFGVPADDPPERLCVRWPDGLEQCMVPAGLDRELRLVHPAAAAP